MYQILKISSLYC